LSQLPPILEKLLNTPGAFDDDAWAAFAREYSTLLLHVARSTSRGTDEAMDAYAFLLERLSEDRCRKLRGYAVNPNSKFTTWLVVVARRICIDHHRVKYGRLRDATSSRQRESRERRRRLAELVERLQETQDVADETAVPVDREVEIAELTGGLAAAMSSLQPADQLLVRMRYEDGLSAAEIAQILRYPSQFHVYRRINSILAELRADLRSRGFESAAS
jgi:RNA polymerase sigma factor (sigma-70 family)